VRILCRRPVEDLKACGVEIFQADLEDSAAIRSACKGVSVVYHVAAKVGAWGKKEDFERANIEGTRAIIDGCLASGVKKLIYTSTPSVVFNGKSFSGADESLPYGKDIPAHYPATKAIAEKHVLTAHDPEILKTVALRPHLIWGVGDRYLVPRVLARARAGRLRIVGEGYNRMDLTHVKNVAEAHLCAERALDKEVNNPGGKAYFISNDEPVVLWEWINDLLSRMEIPPVKKKISLAGAGRIGSLCEGVWKIFRLAGEPPMTRFVASELAKEHWFSIEAAKRDLDYKPIVGMEEGMKELIESLRSRVA
jgi:nucleoside-diphosphate-sugar epimerase